MTIASIATTNDDLNILVAALSFLDRELETNLIATLASPAANVTVFAPTDAAFGQLASDLGFDGDTSDEGSVTEFLIGALPAETLRDVILYHVSGGAKTLSEVAAAGTVNTLNGETISVDGTMLVDKEPDLANPTLVATDIIAENGVVHLIDRVLLPIDIPGNEAPVVEPEEPAALTITGIVAASGDGFDEDNSDFDMLLAAVKAAGLAGALDDPGADLTVFAPTDAAFIGLANGLGYKGSDEGGAFGYIVEALTLLSGGDDPIPLLTQILTYHVAPGSLDATAVLGASSINTLQGGTLGVDGASLVDADPDLANPNIIATDIPASNGIVHAIDGVLLPVDVLASNGRNDVDFKILGDNSDRVYTGRDNDFIDGNGGNDKIFAGSGNDVVLGGEGHDRVYAGSGDDLVRGDAGNDRLYGSWGNDDLDGGAGSDKVSGGSGNDTVTGGEGRDYLYGGWGKDIFVFEQGDGHDYVGDFRNGQDKIDLSDYGLNGIEDLNIHKGWWKSTIELGEGDSLAVRGLNWWNIDENDFIF